jgi:hypothetical protein
LKGYGGNLTNYCLYKVVVTDHGEWRRKRGKNSILFENSWENLEKYKEKNRVNDTKGFRLQNPLDSKCFERRNLGIEWGESGDNNKQGGRGGNPWLVNNWSLD